MTVQIILIAACLICAVPVVYFYEAGKSAASIALKVLASLLFVSLAFLMLYERGNMPVSAILILGALVLGLVGDIFMGLGPALLEKNRSSFFVVGGAAFGFGHFLYAAAFIMTAGVRPALLALLLPVPLIFLVLVRAKLMAPKKMTASLMFYGVILGLILAGGIELLLAGNKIGGFALTGAVLFIASDTMLFLYDFPGERIAKSKKLLRFFHYALMLCYYTAQLLFASTVPYI